jgi:hypothetical protein
MLQRGVHMIWGGIPYPPIPRAARAARRKPRKLQAALHEAAIHDHEATMVHATHHATHLHVIPPRSLTHIE